MEIHKIKVHNVLTCKLQENMNSISKKLKENKDRRIFVVDEKQILQGIITTTDLVYKALAENKTNLLAEDLMTREVLSVDKKEDLNKALEIMHKIKSYSCPLTDNGKIIGLISYHDIVGHVMTSINKP